MKGVDIVFLSKFEDRRSRKENRDCSVAILDPRKSPPRYWWVIGAFLLLASYLLFCHGCHGDEDDELFSASMEFAEHTLGK
jgi:hypothetical protein